MKPLRIAVSGKMTSGKSTVADHLVTEHGFVKIAFANKLKDLCAELFRANMEREKDRDLLMSVGERMRQIDPTVWVRYALDHMPKDRDVAVDDLRFPLEFAALRSAGFVLLRMMVTEEQVRHHATKRYPKSVDKFMDHYSETALDQYVFDHYLDNRPGIALEAIFAHVDRIVVDLRGGQNG